jgi:hypothetical protein
MYAWHKSLLLPAHTTMGSRPLLTTILLQLNDLLAAAVLIIAFSLLAYIALQNLHNAIARALCVLLAGVVIVSGGDVLLGQAQRDQTVQFLLRAQWLGIVCVPAGYIHLSNALLEHSGVPNRRRGLLVRIGYLLSLAFFALAAICCCAAALSVGRWLSLVPARCSGYSRCILPPPVLAGC